MAKVDPIECEACARGDELTHEGVEQALQEADGNVTEAARLLNRHRTSVHRFMREHHITVQRRGVVASSR